MFLLCKPWTGNIHQRSCDGRCNILSVFLSFIWWKPQKSIAATSNGYPAALLEWWLKLVNLVKTLVWFSIYNQA